MTEQQIKYVEHLRQRKADQEQARHNLRYEDIQDFNAKEQKRHNIQTETLGFQNLAETTRHNKASESIGYGQISLGYAQLGEAARANRARESIQASQVQLGYANLAESKRSNLANEQLRSRDIDVTSSLGQQRIITEVGGQVLRTLPWVATLSRDDDDSRTGGGTGTKRTQNSKTYATNNSTMKESITDEKLKEEQKRQAIRTAFPGLSFLGDVGNAIQQSYEQGQSVSNQPGWLAPFLTAGQAITSLLIPV